MEQSRIKIANLPLGKTGYCLEGPKEAPVFVLVHGLSTAHETWHEIAPLLNSSGYRTLRYDLYGRGSSDGGHAKYDLSLYRNQLFQLLTYLGIEHPFHLLGYSMGGGIVADFASLYPSKIKTLHLLAPIGLKCKLSGSWPYLRLPLIGPFFEKRVARELKTSAKSDQEALYVSSDIADAQFMAPDKAGYMHALRRSILDIKFNNLNKIYLRLKNQNFPIQAIWADEDEVIPIVSKDKLKKTNSDVEAYVIEGAGHALAYTHPFEVLRGVFSIL